MKVDTNRRCAMRSWHPRGDEFGGRDEGQLNCKHALATAIGRTRRGATGASRTKMRVARKSPAPGRASFSGVRFCEVRLDVRMKQDWKMLVSLTCQETLRRKCCRLRCCHLA